MDNGKERLSFVIPCYNSQDTIRDVVAELKEEVRKRDGYEYEIILVCDGSKDRTWQVIAEMADADSRIVAVNFSKNFGQASALMYAYRESRGDIVINLDDDGQMPVESIYDLVDAIHEGYDVVFGRYDTIHQHGWRNIGSWINYRMERTMIGLPEGIRPSSFWAGRRFIIDEVAKYDGPYPYIAGLLLRVTKNLKNVPVKHRERASGQSGYSMRKLIRLWMNGFTAFSVMPLRAATVMGFAFAMIGFVFSVILVIRKLINPNMIVGYTSTIVALLMIGGIQMLMIGMLGEYVGRVYMSINGTPQSIIRDKIDRRDKGE